MKIFQTGFKDLLVIEVPIYRDVRGFFMEAYNARVFDQNNFSHNFVQDNQSYSNYRVLRGLHFQKYPHAQTKLIRVLSGKILDVVVDLRGDQSTYKQPFTIELSAHSSKQLLVPKGFAHGFVVLSKPLKCFINVMNSTIMKLKVVFAMMIRN